MYYVRMYVDIYVMYACMHVCLWVFKIIVSCEVEKLTVFINTLGFSVFNLSPRMYIALMTASLDMP